MHEPLIRAMIAYEADASMRVHHFLKVHGFAAAIAGLEGVADDVRFVLEAAAIVHDIGIRPSLDKFGGADGHLQEREGPAVARPMLERLGYAPPVVERVCYLVARHHTYTDIDGPDYQILVEADFLVNIQESAYAGDKVQRVYQRIFRTAAGKEFCRLLYGAEEPE